MKVRFKPEGKKTVLYQDLTFGNVYRVLGIEADEYRLINNEGRPYLYSSDLFEVVDDADEDDWVTEIDEDGKRYSYPRELNDPGFFEDFFDDKREAIIILRKYLSTKWRQATRGGAQIERKLEYFLDRATGK